MTDWQPTQRKPMPEWLAVSLFVGGIFAALGAFVAMIIYATDRVMGPEPKPLYTHGQMVRFKMDHGVVGMIVSVWCSEGRQYCQYSIRTPSLSLSTQTRLFGEDGDVKIGPVTLLYWINEFEIEPS